MYRELRTLEKHSISGIAETTIIIDKNNIAWLFSRDVILCTSLIKETRSSMILKAHYSRGKEITITLKKADYFEIHDSNDNHNTIRGIYERKFFNK